MLRKPRIGLFVGSRSVQAHDLRQRAGIGSFGSLPEALASLGAARADLEIVLSDAFCRYLVMTRPQGVRSRAELSAAMRNRFQAMFGEVESWRLGDCAAPLAKEDLVVGVSRELADRITDDAHAAAARICSMRPHWIAWARHFRAQTRRGQHWIIAADDGWVSVGYVSAGLCRLARSLRLPPGEVNVGDLLARARAFIDDTDAHAGVWLCGEGLAPGSDAAGPFTHAPGAALWGAA